MLSPADDYFQNLEEPHKGVLQYLRNYLLTELSMQEKWQYGMPTYFYYNKRVCHVWVHKKREQPYIGFIDGKKIDDPDLLQEDRARMKIFLIDPARNIPVRKLKRLFSKVMSFYK